MSSEYGWSTEYILDRTEREISWRLENIGIDYENQIALDAKLHGMEYKAPKKKSDVAVKLKPEDEKKIDDVIAQAMKRKRAEYGNRS